MKLRTVALLSIAGWGGFPALSSGGASSIPCLPGVPASAALAAQDRAPVLASSVPGSPEFTIARLRYEGGGDWYAGPSMLPNLLDAIRSRTGLPVAEREATVSLLDPALASHPYLFMTGHGRVAFSPEEREALRGHLLSGGFLHADDNYGLDESLRREIALLFPEKELVEIPVDHPIFRAPYSFPEGIPKIHEHDGAVPRAYGLFHGGRLILLYTHETDLGNGWEDPGVHGNPPEVREQALRMGVNLFLHVVGQVAP